MNVEQRIQVAWETCQSWITEYDGAATEAFLRPILENTIELAIATLEEIATGLKLQAIWNDNINKETTDRAYAKPYAVREYVELLCSGAIVVFTVAYKLKIDQDEVDISIMIEKGEEQRFEGEVIWWSDQVFPKGANHRNRFEQISRHFMALQNLFGSTHLYLSPETFDKPYDEVHYWIEI